MDTIQFHMTLTMMFMKWDPLGYGEEAYETEIVDCIQAMYNSATVDEFAVAIQAIYAFSFEETIELAKCVAIAEQVWQLRNDASCTIN